MNGGWGVHSASVWSTMLYGGMKALQLKATDHPRLQEAQAQPPLEHQVVRPPCHDLFLCRKDLGGAVVHAAEGEDEGVEREAAAGAVADRLVEVFVGQLGLGCSRGSGGRCCGRPCWQKRQP
jgi:hypothetical protein